MRFYCLDFFKFSGPLWKIQKKTNTAVCLYIYLYAICLYYRNHWDHQLYKALEHQYQVGLEALNEYLPEIEVFITYRQQKLQFQPPIEEIRMKYYSQLKRFLAIPKNFRGVSESSENLIFPAIIERNAHRFSHLFSKAEELFIQLVFL